MHCSEVNNLLQDLIDGHLDADDQARITGHIEDCAQCSRDYQAMVAVVSAVKSLPVPEASPGFTKRVFVQATHEQEASNRLPGHTKWAGTAASFILVVSLITSVLTLDKDDTGVAPTLIGSDVQMVQLGIDSKEAISGIEITIEVSSNLAVSGFEGTQTISWVTDLKQGVNVVSLPLYAIASGDGHITTRFNRDGTESVFQVLTRNNLDDPVSSHSRPILAV